MDDIVASKENLRLNQKKPSGVSSAVAKARARVRMSRQGKSASQKRLRGKSKKDDDASSAWLKEIEGKLNSVVKKLDIVQPVANAKGALFLYYSVLLNSLFSYQPCDNKNLID